jgi:hypothetical protein
MRSSVGQRHAPRGYQACAYESGVSTVESGQFHGVMVLASGRGGDVYSIFNAPKAEFITTDPAKFIAWVEKMESQGYVELSEHEAHIMMLRIMAKKRQAELSKPYDPSPEQVAADRANRPSGKGQKPFPKPTRDYKGTQLPKGEWEPIRTKW